MALDKVKQGVIADDAVGSSQIAPDTVVAADIGANAVGTSELEDNITIGGTSHVKIPTGTTEQRPGSAVGGQLRYNTTLNQLEFYNGSSWISTNEMIPAITSLSGSIVVGTATNLTLTGTDFNTTVGVSIQWSEGNTVLLTETGITPTNTTTITRAVPSQVYGQTAGDTISIKVLNAGTTSSNAITTTILALPSGGLNADGSSRSVATSGNYRYHAFLTSGSGANGFVNTIPNLKGEYLIVAGGGGGGVDGGGGGGGGGVLQSTFSSLSTGNKDIVVGAGGTGAHDRGETPGNGSASSALGVSTVGGGGASKVDPSPYTLYQAADGGSGGGGMSSNTAYVAGGSGTAGPPRQGYDGGSGISGASWDGAGGGGAGAAGANCGTNSGGDGGIGAIMTSWATATSTGHSNRYAGGGGGANEGGSNPGAGGTGGGGAGSSGGYGVPGTANTGGGGGGGDVVNANDGGGDGGKGIVIIRYDITDLTS